MRLVWFGKAVWQTLAIADRRGQSVKDVMEAAATAGGPAEKMLGNLQTDVPMNGPPTHNKVKCNSLGDGIFEFKEDQVRVLWFYDEGEPKTRRRIICTHSFAKKTPKTPPEERRRALRLRAQYLSAKASNNLTVTPYKEGPDEQG